MLTPKVSAAHVRCGRTFVGCAYAVGVTAVASSAWARSHPAGFGATLGTTGDEVRRLTPDWQLLFSVLGLAGLSLLAYVRAAGGAGR